MKPHISQKLPSFFTPFKAIFPPFKLQKRRLSLFCCTAPSIYIYCGQKCERLSGQPPGNDLPAEF